MNENKEFNLDSMEKNKHSESQTEKYKILE